jgi:hypothetical protein
MSEVKKSSQIKPSKMIIKEAWREFSTFGVQLVNDWDTSVQFLFDDLFTTEAL